MDQETEATTKMGQAKSSETMQMFLHPGWESIGGFNVGLVEGNSSTLGYSQRATIERVDLSYYGPSNFTSNRESQGVLQAKSDSNCDDASFYDLSISDDRYRCGKEFQGCNVRSVGRVDARGEPKARSLVCGKLQSSYSDGLYFLGDQSLERSQNGRSGEESKGIGHDSGSRAEVEGFIERNFEDPAPSGQEADVHIAELEREFENDEE